MSAKPLDCPSCGSQIRAEDVELSLMIAKCASCDAVFSFASEVGHDEFEVLERATAMPESRPAAPLDRPLTPASHRVVEVAGAQGLVLDMPWYAPHHLFLAAFALFWNGFLFVWYAAALVDMANEGDAFSAALCFPVIHVVIGILVGYSALAGFVNRTRVTVGADRLAVEHGPLPWSGNLSVKREAVSQLFVAQRVIRGKNSSRTVYDLKVQLEDGRELGLIDGVADLPSARFLEHRIEGWVGLADRPVPGEHLG